MPLQVGTDSFATVTEAGAYLASVPDRGDWSGLELARREQLLRLATRLLDDLFEWCGEPADYNQALAFPRKWLPNKHQRSRNVYDWRFPYEASGIPDEIKQATAELAYRLNTKDFTKDTAVVDLDLTRAGTTGFGGGAFRRALPSAVVDMIPSNWYSRVDGAGESGSVRLTRA